MTRFVIAPDGTVDTAAVVSSTTNNLTFECCIVSQTASPAFDHPDGGGIVIVTSTGRPVIHGQDF